MTNCIEIPVAAQQAAIDQGERERIELRRLLDQSERERVELQRRLDQTECERTELQRVLDLREQERIALQTILGQHLEESAARLVKANEQISLEFELRAKMELELRQGQRLEAIGRLAAGIAHEINTPVQFISDSVEFIREGIGELLQFADRYAESIAQHGACEHETGDTASAFMAIDVPYLRAQLPRAMNRVTEGLGRVTKIVRAMKSFSHPSRCDMEPVDLNEALLTTLTVAYSEYKYVAVLETDLGELPLVTCHVNEFNQVIINLVVNAAHAIGDVVATSGDMGRIFIKTWRDGHDVILSLKDTGTGIPEYVREYIFEPFFTTKELGKGTGQGLAIAHAVIVEKHGGSLTFESKIGEGTTFFVRLPIDGPSPRGGGDGIT